MHHYLRRVLKVLPLAFVLALPPVLPAQVTSIAYQGVLLDGTQPVDGTIDLRLTLFDAPTAGSIVAGTSAVTKSNVTVTDGLFTTDVDFGGAAFDGSNRYLEIEIANPAGGGFVTMDSRIQVRVSPYAVSADKLDNLDSTAFMQGSVYDTDSNNTVDNAEIADDADLLDGSDSTDFLDKAAYDTNNDGIIDLEASSQDVESTFTVRNAGGDARIAAGQLANGGGNVYVYGFNDLIAAQLGANGGNKGLLQIFDTAEDARIQLFSSATMEYGFVRLLGDDGTTIVATLREDSSGGRLQLSDETGRQAVGMGPGPAGRGILSLAGTDGLLHSELTANGQQNAGLLNIFDQGQSRVRLFSSEGGAGVGQFLSSAGNIMLNILQNGGADAGLVELKEGGVNRVSAFATESNGGFIRTFNDNDLRTVEIGSNSTGLSNSGITGQTQHGTVLVFDDTGTLQAGIFSGLNASSNPEGVVFGDTKNFVMDNPRDPSTSIVYTSLEGPEAGAYIRGTARLMNGRATITFPEHFQDVINERDMTVQLTPLSIKSMGLAVIQKGENGFTVGELQSGMGSYEFDYMVTGVRAGYEGRPVIVPKGQEIAGMLQQ